MGQESPGPVVAPEWTPLLEKAEAQGLWLYTDLGYVRDPWFSPAEMRKALEGGLYGACFQAFRLRDPREREHELRQNVLREIGTLRRFRDRMNPGRRRRTTMPASEVGVTLTVPREVLERHLAEQRATPPQPTVNVFGSTVLTPAAVDIVCRHLAEAIPEIEQREREHQQALLEARHEHPIALYGG